MSAPRSLVAFSLGFIVSTLLALAAGCSTSAAPADPPHDAAPRLLDPAGSYTLASTYSLAAPPAAASTVLDELLAATDGPDDPSRYLIDLMIARLPEGRTRTYAAAVAPYVAAYVNERIGDVAPRFAPGARALGSGLSRIAHRFGTLEDVSIGTPADIVATIADAQASNRRSAWRTVTGLRFDLVAPGTAGASTEQILSVDVPFAPLGMPDTAATTHVIVAGDALTFGRHTIALPYTALVRLGFDFAVIPSVVPGTRDLADALANLVDCDHLGTLVSDWIGLGSPSFYTSGCTAGLTALAARIYARLDAIDATSVSLELAGTVRGTDADGDARLDALVTGTWTGSFAGSPVAGQFAGERR